MRTLILNLKLHQVRYFQFWKHWDPQSKQVNNMLPMKIVYSLQLYQSNCLKILIKVVSNSQCSQKQNWKARLLYFGTQNQIKRIYSINLKWSDHLEGKTSGQIWLYELLNEITASLITFPMIILDIVEVVYLSQLIS